MCEAGSVPMGVVGLLSTSRTEEAVNAIRNVGGKP